MSRSDAGAPVLALVESNTTGTGRMFAAVARSRGLRPVLLSSRPERYPWVGDDAVDVSRADTTDADAVADSACAAAGDAPLAGLLTSSEYFVAVTARAATRLGLPGADPDAVERCRDKGLQRAALAGSGITVPAFARAATPEEAARAATAIGCPVVVKPVDGTGSRGVRLCCDPAEVAAHTATLLGLRQDERGGRTLPAVLIEEYVSGTEVSVETFGTAVIGVTAKYLGHLPSFVEVGHDFPAELAAADAAGSLAIAAVRALGLGFGPAHTEIRLGPRGPVVIEVNPRLAGGRIPTLIRVATGIDLVGATVDAAIGAVVGRPSSDDRCHASIRFLVPPRPGRVRRTAGVAQAAAVPGVVDVAISARAGQHVGGTGSFLDRVGHVITAGPTGAAARAAAETALSLLEIDVEADADAVLAAG